jgi:hypothetical protein
MQGRDEENRVTSGVISADDVWSPQPFVFNRINISPNISPGEDAKNRQMTSLLAAIQNIEGEREEDVQAWMSDRLKRFGFEQPQEPGRLTADDVRELTEDFGCGAFSRLAQAVYRMQQLLDGPAQPVEKSPSQKAADLIRLRDIDQQMRKPDRD